MNKMESNKIMAALLVAGILALLAGFISQELTGSKKITEMAYKIEGSTPAAKDGKAAAPTHAEPVEDLLAGADIAQGEKISKTCASCHTFNKGDPHRVGPNLYGIVGSLRASKAGFAYSDAMKAKGGTWDTNSLNDFLWNTKKSVPGTKMVFAGLKKPEDRAALIKWLSTRK